MTALEWVCIVWIVADILIVAACRLLWRNIAADDPTDTDGDRPQRGSS